MEAKKILIGVPSQRQDSRFLASLNNLIGQMDGKYQVSLLVEKWQRLSEAQNHIVDYLLSRDFDYLLFLDDDHWGHKVEMVDCLIGANAYMATIKTYVRHFPYPIAFFTIGSNREYTSKFIPQQGYGYKEVDMTGFPMTLIKPQLFNKIDKPYFRGREYGGRDWNTDIDFCERINMVGIKPVACYQFCLPHDDITEENVTEMRIKNMSTMKDRIMAHFFLNQGQVIKTAS